MESISVPYRIESYHDKVNELLAMNDNIMDDDSNGTVINLELKPCPICTRTFVPDTLKKHVIICEKMAQKKRKIFDSSRQRREGTELANYLPKGFGLPENKKQYNHQTQQIYQKHQHHHSLDSNIQNHHQHHQHQQKKRNSSSESEQTSNNVLDPIKQNDNLQTPPLKELPSICTLTSTTTLQPKRSIISNVSTVVSPVTTCKMTTPESKQKISIERKRNLLPPSEPCPYCERCFGVKAYDRHVEWCKEKARLLENKKNTTKTPAKERLEARIRYRAPCLKSKRAANREKYSGLPCDDSISLIDGYSEKSGSSDPRKFGMSASLSSSIMSDRTFNIDKETTQENFNKNENENIENVECIKKSPTDNFNQTSKINNSEIIDDSNCLQEMPVSDKRNNENQSISLESINNIWTDRKENSNSDLCRVLPVLPSSLSIETETNENSVTNEENSNNQDNEEFDFEFDSNFEEIIENFEKKIKSKLSDNNNDENSNEIPLNCFEIDEIFINMDTNKINDMENFLSILEQQDNNEYLDSNSLRSGMSDKYDPFLSAKRQLEELCSPTSTEPSVTPTTPNTPNTPKTPKTKKLSSSYTPMTTTTPTSNTMTNTTSNFRRTSSLRVSRKKTTPSYSHHPSSRPLFCQSKERPTIQRGISDEGPISSSFLKPEEYDEMPVKSACVNDLAISAQQNHHHHHHNSNSPKIIKRDINSSINRRNLRLNINNNNKPISNNAITNTSNCKDKITLNVVGSSSLINPISKTDSLAIFLKYENETKNSSTSIDKKSLPSPLSSSLLSVKLTEKDLKDKTNTTLSKNQILSSSTGTSSNKLLPAINQIDCSKMNFNNTDDNTNINISDNNNINNNRFKEISTVMTINKIHPIKLEPLPKNIISLNSINLQNENSNNDNNRNIMNTNTINTNSIQTTKSLNLNSILLDTTKDTTDFIDPKLINVCDNLPINITKFSDSDQTSTSSTDSVSTTKYSNLEEMNSIIQTNQQINQLQQKQQQQHSQIQQQQKQQQHQPPSVINRNSSEKRNLLKRQLRLGKNQFLYDISPDDDNDDNDDNNDDNNCVVIDTYSDHLDKTISMIDTSNDNNDPDNTNKQHRINNRRNNCDNTNQIINTNNNELPTFDDFDFEEFLSSFDENDEQQYPIFKDYKQFLLMNRCSLNKQQQQQQQQQTQTQQSTQNQQQIQKQSNNDIINNSSNNRTKLNEIIPVQCVNDKDNEADRDGDDEEEFCDNDDIDLESRKNEIFISIETNQTSSDDNDVILIDGSSSLLSSSPLISLNKTIDSKPNTNDSNMMENNLCKMNKDEKSDNIINNYNDMNRNKTKTFNEHDEMIGNEATREYQQQQQQQQQQHRRQQKQLSENNMLFELQDSDEICSSIDENFSIHEHNNSLRSKQNADSAYGSLSRHSPIDQQLKRNSSRTRLQSAPTSNKKSITNNDDKQSLLDKSPTLLHTKFTKSTTWNENNNTNNRTISNCSSSSGSSSGSGGSTNNNNNNNNNKHNRNRNFSASSSGSSSDNSLPLLLSMGSVSGTQLIMGKDEKLLLQKHNQDNDNNEHKHYQQHQQQQQQPSPITRKRAQSIESKMSKFCHECGSKFIVTQAKFCMECGVKRIIIE